MMDNNNINPIAKTLEKTKQTQDELAEQLGVSRQTISNYMADPDKIPRSVISELLKLTGYTYETLFGEVEKERGPVLRHCYPDLVKEFHAALEGAEKQFKIIEKINVDGQEAEIEQQMETIHEEFRNIEKIAGEQFRKVTVCAYGESDTGKSTLMNQLLNEEVAPTNYTPITSAVTYFRHISEKPAYLEEGENAVVYGREKNAVLPKFEHYYADDEIQAKKYVVREGDYQSVLRAFGTREGAYFNNTRFYIDEIDVFLDNNALKEMTLIDIPGFGSDEEKDNVGLTMDMSKFDVIIFLSLANGFLRGEEITAAKQILKSREELASFYILASHANSVGDPEKVKGIMGNGCRRLANSMTDRELEEIGVSMDNLMALYERCYGYDVFNKVYCEAFNKDFERTIPLLNKRRVEKAKANLKKACGEMCDKYEKLQVALEEESRWKSDEEEQKIFYEELSRVGQEIKDKMEKNIEKCRENSGNRFYKDYAKVMNEDFLLEALERKGIKNKKNDLKEFTSYVSSEINDRIRDNLRDNSESFAYELNKNIEAYEEVWNQGYNKRKINIDMSSFDFQAAFAGGLAGVATYGALALWATVVAAGSNLGGYILLAKVVSVLSTIGISVGGTGAAAAFVASIGGPVVLAIAIAAMAAVAVFGVISGNWKSRFVKRLIKTFDEKGFRKECEDTINVYWDDTRTALEECLEALKAKSVSHYEQELKRSGLSDKVKAFVNAALKMIYDGMVNIYKSMGVAL